MDALVAKIAAHPSHRPAKTHHVSVYRRTRCYGGCEEGGWWYDRNELVGSIPFPTEEEAHQWLDAAKAEVEAENRRTAPARHRAMARLPDADTAYSGEGYIPAGWSDGGELFVIVEERCGEAHNMDEEAPHYE